MEREEILEKARKENAGTDEVKRFAESAASGLAEAVGLAACMLFSLLDKLVLKTGVVGSVCWIIYGIMVTTNLWAQAAVLKKKGWFIGAIVTTLMVIALTVELFWSV